MDREQAKDQIKAGIMCTDYLQPARNHSGNNGYICPLCNSGAHGANSTGAVKYYPTTNTWYCFSCHRGGDVIDLYKAQNSCDYNEALANLAAVIGTTIDSHAQGQKTSPQGDVDSKGNMQNPAAEKDAENAKQSPADYSAYYAICRDRLDDTAALSYLRARGISKGTAAACGIGFDPEADPAGTPGAIRGEYKAHPTPRIIVPCTSDFYIARSIDPNTPEQYKAPNPKGSSTKLFNAAALYEGKPAVFVTEGIFDALAFIETGQAAIATNGKGNGKLLLHELQKCPAETAFIICHDNDDNPDTAADTMKRADELNNALRIAGYKSIVYNVAGDQHDANDALVNDTMAFIQNIDKARQELQHEINRDDLTDFFDKIQTEAYKPKATGISFIDRLLYGGIIPQTLILLMATPGAGKTTLCQQIAEKLAEQGQPVIYYNFEMSTEEMLAKAISSKYYRGNGGDMSMLDVLQGYKWTDTERAGISKTVDEYRRDNYPNIKYNPDSVSANLDDLLQYLNRKGAEAQAAGTPAPAAFIDYIHLLTTDDKAEDAELIKRAVTGLKQYAIRYNTFVVGIIAANRESAKNGRLTLESGRDSSNLEYTADIELSLTYTEIDSGKVDPQHPDEVEQLKLQNPRAMTIRTLKTRGIPARPAAKVMYDTRHNIFYDTVDDFVPADDAGSFDEKTKIVKVI